MYPHQSAQMREINLSEFAEPDRLAEDKCRARRPKLILVGASSLLLGCLIPALSKRLFDIVSVSEVNGKILPQEYLTYDLVLFFAQPKGLGQNVALSKEVLEQMVHPSPPFVVLADSEDLNDIIAAFEAGARAYIPTSVSLEVMIEAIRLVIAGGTYFPSCIISVHAGSFEEKNSGCPLTPRELAVLGAVRQGLPNKVIAQELGISESTIKVHVHRLLKKLKVRNRTQAAIWTSLPDAYNSHGARRS